MKVMVLVLTRGVASACKKRRGADSSRVVLKPDLHFVFEGLPTSRSSDLCAAKMAKAKLESSLVQLSSVSGSPYQRESIDSVYL